MYEIYARYALLHSTGLLKRGPYGCTRYYTRLLKHGSLLVKSMLIMKACQVQS